MFCPKCGTELTEEDRFCKSCGMPVATIFSNVPVMDTPVASTPVTPVTPTPNTPEELYTGALLFESKGIPTKVKKILGVCSVVAALAGVAIAFIANMRYSFSGDYMLPDASRKGLTTAGIIAVLFGVLFFTNIFAMNQSFVKFYEKKIVGLNCTEVLFKIKKFYEIDYNQISYVQVVPNPIYGDKIIVKTQTESHALTMNGNVEQAKNLIMQKMRK